MPPSRIRRPILFLALLQALLAATPRPAAAQVLVPGFWGANGPVYTSALRNDRLYLGGAFDYVGPHTGTGVSVDPANGVTAIESTSPSTSGFHAATERSKLILATLLRGTEPTSVNEPPMYQPPAWSLAMA